MDSNDNQTSGKNSRTSQVRALVLMQAKRAQKALNKKPDAPNKTKQNEGKVEKNSKQKPSEVAKEAAASVAKSQQKQQQDAKQAKQQQKSNDKPQNNAEKPKAASAIDDIFSALKDKGAIQKKKEQKKKQEQAAKKQAQQEIEEETGDLSMNNEDGFADLRSEPKPRKFVDGVAVYSEDDLNIGQGGNTDLCPFEFVQF